MVGERVENFHALAEQALGIDPAFLEDHAADLGIDEISQFGRVDLDVLASQAR